MTIQTGSRVMFYEIDEYGETKGVWGTCTKVTDSEVWAVWDDMGEPERYISRSRAIMHDYDLGDVP